MQAHHRVQRLRSLLDRALSLGGGRPGGNPAAGNLFLDQDRWAVGDPRRDGPGHRDRKIRAGPEEPVLFPEAKGLAGGSN